MGDRSQGVGERGQFFPYLRRIVGLCYEKTPGAFFRASPEEGEAQGCAEQNTGEIGHPS